MKRERQTKEVKVDFKNPMYSVESCSTSEMLQEGPLSSKTINSATSTQIDSPNLEKYDEPEIGFVRLDFFNPLCNLSAVQPFSFSNIVQLFPWSSKLNEEYIHDALEIILTFFAIQIGITLQSRNYDELFKENFRDLYIEMKTFHEFVRQILQELYNTSGKGNTLFLTTKQESEAAPIGIAEAIKIKKVRTYVESDDDISYNSTLERISSDTDLEQLMQPKHPVLHEKNAQTSVSEISPISGVTELESDSEAIDDIPEDTCLLDSRPNTLDLTVSDDDVDDVESRFVNYVPSGIFNKDKTLEILFSRDIPSVSSSEGDFYIKDDDSDVSVADLIELSSNVENYLHFLTIWFEFGLRFHAKP